MNKIEPAPAKKPTIVKIWSHFDPPNNKNINPNTINNKDANTLLLAIALATSFSIPHESNDLINKLLSLVIVNEGIYIYLSSWH